MVHLQGRVGHVVYGIIGVQRSTAEPSIMMIMVYPGTSEGHRSHWGHIRLNLIAQCPILILADTVLVMCLQCSEQDLFLSSIHSTREMEAKLGRGTGFPQGKAMPGLIHVGARAGARA